MSFTPFLYSIQDIFQCIFEYGFALFSLLTVGICEDLKLVFMVIVAVPYVGLPRKFLLWSLTFCSRLRHSFSFYSSSLFFLLYIFGFDKVAARW